MLTLIFKLKTYNRDFTLSDLLLTTRQVELIEKKEFAAAALDPKYEAFIVHITAFSIDLGDKMHPFKKTQIAHLKANKALIKIFSKYTDFIDVFSPKLAVELPEYTKINNYAIKLIDN